MDIRQIVATSPVLPVIVIDDVARGVALAQALVDGGIRTLEVTLRTNAALDVIRAIRAQVPQAIVGVGTITRPAEIDAALAAGAVFGVSPGATPELLDAVKRSGMPFLPGVMTPSDVIATRAAGFSTMKLFPAQQAGGVGMLKALAGPFPDLLFCPTGGVSAANAAEFLALKNVICVGGSWLAPPPLVEACDWDAIRSLAKQASALRASGAK
jgi:2-dehydro-3-deoxyphosphogluconate aldolase/(4S)-4-hydroxy-2-oxoglutarate aldolase